MLDPMSTRTEVSPLARVEPAVDPLPRAEDLLDRSVSDRVHAHLQTGVVSVAEESLEDLLVEGQLAAAVSIGVGIADRGGARTEGAVRRQVAADPSDVQLDGLGHVHHPENALDRDREVEQV